MVVMLRQPKSKFQYQKSISIKKYCTSNEVVHAEWSLYRKTHDIKNKKFIFNFSENNYFVIFNSMNKTNILKIFVILEEFYIKKANNQSGRKIIKKNSENIDEKAKN